MNDNGNPNISLLLKILAWISAAVGIAMVCGGFSDSNEMLVLSGAGAIASALFMGAAGVALDKLAAIERNTRKLAEAAVGRDAASA